MSYEYDPRRRRRSRVPPQLRAWVYGRRRGRRYDPDPVRRRRYRARRRYRYEPEFRIRGRRLGGLARLSKLLAPLAGIGVFIEQCTEKDRAASTTFPTMSTGDKLKFIVDVIAQRVAGVSVFKMGVWPRTFNIGGMLNKWVGVGVALMAAGMLPMVPWRGRLRSFGANIALGGGLGGLFDQPALQTTRYNPELDRRGVAFPLIPQRQPGSVWA